MSKTKTTVYLTYFFPGILFDEESVKTVAERDTKAAAKSAPEDAFAFQFHDQATTVIDGETFAGKAKNFSPLYYLGGEVFTLPEVQKRFPGEKVLISNMRGNGYERVIKTRSGNWKPLEKKDVLV